MSQPSADARAVVRAAEALTTQVRRIADAMQTPVVEGVASGSGDCGCYNLGPREPGHTRCELGHTLPPARETDDGPTTPATTCNAQYIGPDNPWTECIRAAQHEHPFHTNEGGWNWRDDIAVYPTDSTVKVAHWHPVAEQLAGERQELASMVGAFVDAQVQHARAAEDRLPCPYCVDRQLIPRPQLVEHIARLHPHVETEGPGADEETSSGERRKSLAVLLSRAQRGVTPLTAEESDLLRRHVETEIREAKTARAVARSNLRHVQVLVPELTAAQAAIERVRDALKVWSSTALPRSEAHQVLADVRAALDDTEQPTTEA
jgi:hypothetical protein